MTIEQKVDYIFEVMSGICEEEGEFEELVAAMHEACEDELESE